MSNGRLFLIMKINGPDCVVCESPAEFLVAVLTDDLRIYGTRTRR